MIRHRLNLDLAILTGLCLAVNGAYLAPDFIPVHDTAYAVGMFHYFLNNLSYSGELPAWMIHGFYGIDATIFRFECFTGMSYVALFVGYLIGADDALWLFKLGIVGEQLIFVFGIYLLARRLFVSRVTQLAVGMASTFCTVWYWQLFFNFRLFYCLPFLIYFLLRFFVDRRPAALWLAGTTAIVGAVGGPVYGCVFWLYLSLLLCLCLIPTHWRAIGCLRQCSLPDLTAVALFIVALVAVYSTLDIPLDDYAHLGRGRDHEHGTISREVFLNYGRIDDGNLVLNWLKAGRFIGRDIDGDVIIYFGFLPLVALFIALVCERRALFISLFSAGAVVTLFACGSVVTRLAYELPMMPLFRHIGFTAAAARVFFVLAAGFGFDVLLRRSAHVPSRSQRYRLAEMVGVSLLIWVFITLGPDRGRHGLLVAGPYVAAFAFYLGFRFRDGLKQPSSTMVSTGLLLALTIDILCFQVLAWRERPRLHEPISFSVRPPSYQPTRELITARPLALKTVKTLSAPVLVRESRTLAVVYQSVFSSMPFDPVMPVAKTEVFPAGVIRLLQHRGVDTHTWKNMAARLDSDRALAAIVGYKSPKLRLVSHATIVDDATIADHILTSTADLDQVVVLTADRPTITPAATTDSFHGTIDVVDFSANTLTASVMTEVAAWLVYADSAAEGWHATVDGRSVPIATAYGALKAIHLPAGTHHVQFRYRPANRVGLMVLSSIAAAFSIAALAVMLYVMVTPRQSGIPANATGDGDMTRRDDAS